jgi:hypothetical protein
VNVGKMLVELGFKPPPPRSGLAAPAIVSGRPGATTAVYDDAVDGHVTVPRTPKQI